MSAQRGQTGRTRRQDLAETDQRRAEHEIVSKIDEAEQEKIRQFATRVKYLVFCLALLAVGTGTDDLLAEGTTAFVDILEPLLEWKAHWESFMYQSSWCEGLALTPNGQVFLDFMRGRRHAIAIALDAGTILQMASFEEIMSIRWPVIQTALGLEAAHLGIGGLAAEALGDLAAYLRHLPRENDKRPSTIASMLATLHVCREGALAENLQQAYGQWVAHYRGPEFLNAAYALPRLEFEGLLEGLRRLFNLLSQSRAHGLPELEQHALSEWMPFKILSVLYAANRSLPHPFFLKAMAGHDSTALSYTWPKPPPRALRPLNASQGYWVSHIAVWDRHHRRLDLAWARVTIQLNAYCKKYTAEREEVKAQYGIVPARK